MAKGIAAACNTTDNGAWDTALAYIETLPMARKEYGKFLTGGFGGAFGSYTKDRNYPAVCSGPKIREMIEKADDARSLLLQEAGRR